MGQRGVGETRQAEEDTEREFKVKTMRLPAGRENERRPPFKWKRRRKAGCEDCEPLEERVPEPEPCREIRPGGGPVFAGRPNSKAGGGLSLLVSPEFKLCRL